jgi:hypothetical protein
MQLRIGVVFCIHSSPEQSFSNSDTRTSVTPLVLHGRCKNNQRIKNNKNSSTNTVAYKKHN